MDVIFHEKQEGQLCAKHCLNAVLQGPYFTEIDLAYIAQSIDEQEQRQMAEGGVNTEEYLRFLAAPSHNMDDSGFFSIQVLTKALQVWDLEMIPFSSQNLIAKAAREDPTEHWFTIRKIGQQWFNLNSLLPGPELISDTYLALFLTQLQQEQYSIFILSGELPSSRSDQILSTMLVTDNSSENRSGTTYNSSDSLSDISSEEERSVQIAIQASLESELDEEERQIQAALAKSLECQ